MLEGIESCEQGHTFQLWRACYGSGHHGKALTDFGDKLVAPQAVQSSDEVEEALWYLEALLSSALPPCVGSGQLYPSKYL